MNTSERSMQLRVAAHISWANTPDRASRTANARRASHWTRFLDMAREKYPDATDEQIAKVAESLRSAHYSELARRSAAARRLKAETNRANRTARTRAEVEQFRTGRPAAA